MTLHPCDVAAAVTLCWYAVNRDELADELGDHALAAFDRLCIRPGLQSILAVPQFNSWMNGRCLPN